MIGPQYELYYGDNEVNGIVGPLAEAIANFALMANFTPSITSGPPVLGVQFNSNSTSPNGDIQSWEWDFDYDGVVDSYEENPYYEYTVPGTYSVHLVVADSIDVAEILYENLITVQNSNDISGTAGGLWSMEYSPYVVNGDLDVPEGNSLIIETGTEVLVNGGSEITVHGQIYACGTLDQKVIFHTGDSWKGIRISGSQQENIIQHCEISGATNGAISIDNDGQAQIIGNWIINNSCSANRSAGIDISDADNVLILRNIIANNASSNLTGGIALTNSDVQIKNNLIVNNGGSNALAGAISCKNGSSPLVQNNTIANNQASTSCIFIFNSGPIIRNSIISHTGNIFTTIGATHQVSYSCVTGGYTGTGNINVDPAFQSPSLGIGPAYNGYIAGWYLTEDSECIDAGNPDPEYYDIEDAANPGFALWPAMGTIANDMGAFGGSGGLFEYTGSEENQIIVPDQSLVNVYPNPFNPTTNILLQLSDQDKDSPVTINIFNLKGQLVKTLIDLEILSNRQMLTWDGTDDQGAAVASGLYLMQIQTANTRIGQKLMLLK